MADFGVKYGIPEPRFFKVLGDGTREDPHIIATSLTDSDGNEVSSDSDAIKISPQIVDEYGNVIRQLGDNIFKGAILTIPVEHHEIHCGDSYECSYIADLGNGAALNILIIVPDEGLTETEPGAQQNIKQYHFKGSVYAQAEATVEIYEAATVSSNGTSLSVFNRNRNSTNTDYLGITHTPTVTGTGTRIEVVKIGASKSTGGQAGRAEEWILKDNTIYLLRVTNNTTSDNYISINLNYYVHPGI